MRMIDNFYVIFYSKRAHSLLIEMFVLERDIRLSVSPHNEHFRRWRYVYITKWTYHSKMERSLRYLLFSENRFDTSFFNDLENQLRQISRKSFVICAKPILNCFWFILEGKEKINVIIRRFWNFWKNNGTH